MKIAIITTHPIQYHAPLFSYLSKNPNYSIKVFYTLGNQDIDTYDKDFGITRNWNLDLLTGYEFEFLENASTNPSSNLFWGINNPNIIIKIRNYNPNVILVYGWKHYSHLNVLRFFKGKVPLLFRGDSTTLDDFTKSPLYNTVKYTILKWIYRKVDYVLSPGKASDKYFKKVGIPKCKIIRTPHSVDNKRFSLFTGEENWRLCELKKELLISNTDFIFLFAGKFIDKKNPLLLIKAFEALADENETACLVLVGNGDLEKTITVHVASLPTSISKRIHILPFQDQIQMKVIYRLADIFVLPSKGPGETWGLSVNESLASGTPVIVSDKCGSSFDLVKDSYNGFIFQSENIDSLLIKMKQCLDNSTLMNLKKNAQSSVQNFSYTNILKAIDSIVQAEIKN